VPASLRGIGAQAAHAMYWSNSFSGGVLIALAAAGFGFAALRPTAR